MDIKAVRQAYLQLEKGDIGGVRGSLRNLLKTQKLSPGEHEMFDRTVSYIERLSVEIYENALRLGRKRIDVDLVRAVIAKESPGVASNAPEEIDAIAEIVATTVQRRLGSYEGGSQTHDAMPKGDRSVGYEGRPYADDAMMHTGREWWDETYRVGMTDIQAAQFLAKKLGTNVGNQQFFARFIAKWAHFAFQKIVTSHTYAAALMCSDAPREVVADLEVSWKAFLIVVPDGIFDLTTEAYGTMCLRRIAIAIYDQSVEMIIYDPSSTYGRDLSVIVRENNLADLLFQEQPMDSDDLTEGKGARILTMAKRLVVGLLLAYANTGDHKTRTSGGSAKVKNVRKLAEPTHRITFIGKPMKVDCRPAVARYLGGSKGKAPTMQSLVRGHHKRQVVGVARAGRKVIWVEPYWRGPEDAPILTRPKLLN